jgi:hypothetical protein
MITLTININSHDIKVVREILGARWLVSSTANGMKESLEYLVGETQKRTPIDSGRGRSSITYNPAGLRGNRLDSLRGTVYSPEVHVAVMEKGRRVGAKAPPLAPLRLWLIRHGGDPSKAFLLAIRIKRRGMWNGGHGLHMFEEAAKAGRPVIAKILQRHIQRGIDSHH